MSYFPVKLVTCDKFHPEGLKDFGILLLTKKGIFDTLAYTNTDISINFEGRNPLYTSIH